jgi:hypothetical protein
MGIGNRLSVFRRAHFVALGWGRGWELIVIGRASMLWRAAQPLGLHLGVFDSPVS